MVRLNLIAAALAAPAAALAATSSCPYNYPENVNSTESGNGLIFTIISSDAATDNRAVQLRPNPFLAGAYYAAVDATSPVLLANLQDGGVYSEGRDEFNQLYTLGPTAYLNERQIVGNSTQYTVGFANATQVPGTVDTAWSLLATGDDGTYSLFHAEPVEVVNGFLVCPATFDLENGPWYQVLYETYTGAPGDYPGCVSVGVRTTVAPIILNGECTIGA